MTTISASLARGWLLLRDIHRGCRCERCIVTVPSAECPVGAGRARGVHEAEKYRLSVRFKLLQINRVHEHHTSAAAYLRLVLHAAV